jgi:hypothetical protein
LLNKLVLIVTTQLQTDNGDIRTFWLYHKAVPLYAIQALRGRGGILTELLQLDLVGSYFIIFMKILCADIV